MLLWGLSKLSKSYRSEIPVTTSYINLPVDKVLVRPLITQLSVSVKGSGFRLLLAQLGFIKKELTLDYKYYKNYNQIESKVIRGQLADALSPDFELFDIYPTTLPLLFDIKVSKTVPILLNANISFEKQYDFSGSINLTPDSITISGPKEIVDTITRWETDELFFEKLNESKSGELSLIKADSLNLELNKLVIDFKIPVELYTEASIDVEMHLINVPKDITVDIHPKKTSITYLVGTSNYDNVNAELFKAIIDFSKINLERDKYATIELIQQPDYIKNPKLRPKSVEFIIYK